MYLHNINTEPLKKNRNMEPNPNSEKPILRLITDECIAPYHWNRQEHHREKDTSIIRSAADVIKDFKIDADTHMPTVLHRTAKMLKSLTESTRYRIYLVAECRTKIVYIPPEVEKIPDVPKTWTLDKDRTIAIFTAKSKEKLIVNSVYRDLRFPDRTGWPESDLTSVICVPIMSMNDQCFGVFEFAKTKDQFQKNDVDILTVVTGWLSSSIEQFQKCKLSKKTDEINSKLQQMLTAYFANKAEFEDVIDEFLKLLKKSISATRVTFYLINTKDSSMCHLFSEGTYQLPSRFVPTKLKKDLTGTPLLVSQHLKIIYENHNATMFAPITTQLGKCEAIVEATKQQPEVAFSADDMHLVRTVFSRCCSSIIGYKKQSRLAEMTIAGNIIRNDFLMNRLQVRYISNPLQRSCSLVDISKLSSFMWYPVDKSTNDLIQLSCDMILDVCDSRFLEPDTVFLFVITLSKFHQQLPVHNFEASFMCLQKVYCILRRYTDRFTDVEKISLMIGSLSTNIDHTGCSNSLLRITKHPLAIMHKNACLQMHQMWLVQMIIQNTDVLSHMDKTHAASLMQQLEQQIIPSDYFLRFNRDEVEAVCRLDPQTQRCMFDWSNERHRMLLRGLIANISHLNMYCMPYRVSSMLVMRHREERLAEGDLVRAHGMTPLPHMDRAMEWPIPEWHVKLVRLIMPFFELLQNVLPDTGELWLGSKTLCKSWQEVIDSRGQKVWSHDSSWSR